MSLSPGPRGRGIRAHVPSREPEGADRAALPAPACRWGHRTSAGPRSLGITPAKEGSAPASLLPSEVTPGPGGRWCSQRQAGPGSPTPPVALLSLQEQGPNVVWARRELSHETAERQGWVLEE